MVGGRIIPNDPQLSGFAEVRDRGITHRSEQRHIRDGRTFILVRSPAPNHRGRSSRHIRFPSFHDVPEERCISAHLRSRIWRLKPSTQCSCYVHTIGSFKKRGFNGLMLHFRQVPRSRQLGSAAFTFVNQRRRHLFERRHARRSVVIGRGRICPWLGTLAWSDQAATAP